MSQQIDLRKITLPEMFVETVESGPDRAALLVKEGGEYRPITFGDYACRVDQVTNSLGRRGVQAGDRVCILSENRPEWVVADLAILSLGAVVVPIYPTLPPAQVEYILRDSGAVAIFVSDAKQLAKVLEVRDRLPQLKRVIVMEHEGELPEGTEAFASLDEAPGIESPDEASFARTMQPDDLASIVYTSGTTGEPKGAMLTHYNFTSNAQMTLDRFEVRPEDIVLSYIPLSHIFSRVVNYCALAVGATTAFAGSIFTVATNLREVRPTLLPTVPRLLESIQSRAMAVAARGGNPGSLAETMGGRLRAIISGGGPLPVETGTFFSRNGMLVIEGYGLTEIAGVGAAYPVDGVKLGTIGPPLAGVEAKLAEDGEILLRGPNVMQGYYNKEEESRQAVDPDGWFHTGDIGEFDADGYIRITDRKKDLIVLSNGKKVAPQGVERVLKASRFIADAALVGDGQSGVSALIVPDFAQVRAWAKEQGLELSGEAEIAASPEVKKLIKAEIDAHSGDLADFERVKRFALLDREFSMEKDELTPTLKLKRRVIAVHFADQIRGLFGD